MDAQRIITLEEIEFYGNEIATKYNCIFNISTNFTFIDGEIHRRYIIVSNKRFNILDGKESAFTDDKQLERCLRMLLESEFKKL